MISTPHSHFISPGFNVRPLDINSFIVLRQLDKVDKFAQARDRNHRRYMENLRDDLEFQDVSNNNIVASISFGALAKDNQQRRKIVSEMTEKGIDSRIYSAGSLDQHPLWFERHPKINDSLSLKIHETGFFIPNNQELQEKDIDFISSVVKNAING